MRSTLTGLALTLALAGCSHANYNKIYKPSPGQPAASDIELSERGLSLQVDGNADRHYYEFDEPVDSHFLVRPGSHKISGTVYYVPGWTSSGKGWEFEGQLETLPDHKYSCYARMCTQTLHTNYARSGDVENQSATGSGYYVRCDDHDPAGRWLRNHDIAQTPGCQ